MFISTDPFMVLDLSTFLQFTESIQASNGAASESQVVGYEKKHPAVFVMVAESAEVETLTRMLVIQNQIN